MSAASLGKVLVTGSSVDQHFLKQLMDAGFIVHNPASSYPPAILSESDLANELKDCVAYLLGGDEFASRTALAAAPSLRIVSFLGVGHETFVDADAATELGIAVTNTPGTLANSMAEFAIGMLLAIRRQILDYGRAFRRGDPGIVEKQRDIAGHKVGIIGLGGIGTRLAEILRFGFGAEVSYFSRTRKPDQELRLEITYKSLLELLQWVEILFLLVPETPATIGMLGEEQIRLLGDRGVYIVNVARPAIIEPSALLNGLRGGGIEAAAIDAFYKEDIIERDELLALPDSKLLVTPHIGSLTHDARDAMAAKCVTSIINVINTGTDSNIVNNIAVRL